MVERIDCSFQRLQRLITAVLDVSRLESGTAVHDIRPFDLADVVRSAVDEVCSVDPQARCEVSVDRQLPAALADRDEIWRVSANLVSNAVKYSPPGSPVTVAVRRKGEDLLVSVRDHGAGIALSDQPKLFQRFSRLESGDVQGGNGLGLFICKSLVESLGGSIWVEAPPAKARPSRSPSGAAKA